jgi:hypothetical protein
MSFLNRVKTGVSAAPGVGSFSLGSADPGFQDWATAGAVNGTAYSYTAVEGLTWEVGVGTYNSGVLTRDTVSDSSLGAGEKIDFGVHAKVFCTPTKESLATRNESEQYSIAMSIVFGG